MNQKSALIIISPLPSHALPSFYFAELLKAEGYVVYYFVHKAGGIQELIEQNGFTFIRSMAENVGYMAEMGYVVNNFRKKNFLYKCFKLGQVIYSNQLFHERRREIDELVEKIRPALVLIDIFSITNYLFFHGYRQQMKVAFFSPMLSTHTVKGFPILSDTEWIQEERWEKMREQQHPLKKSHSRINKFLDRMILRRICRKVRLPPENALHFDKNLFTLYSFENVPELVLAPLELEVSPVVKARHQHYLGLCIQPHFQIHNVDQQFDISQVVAMKQQAQKIVLCSFGTYFTSFHQHKTILTFITNIIEAVSELEDTQLIVASNERVLEVLKKTLPDLPGIHLYSKVPQRKVLEYADLFITHSGLGSIKESIACGVPMLACPLEPRWDNNGNAYKIAYHQIGVRGDMEKDTSEDLKEKISDILQNKMYKENVVRMRDTINGRYSTHTFHETVNNLS